MTTLEAGTEALTSPAGFDELFRRIEDEDTTYVLLNVLPRAAFEAGRIPGSLNLPLGEIAERAHEALPSREQETIVYCASSHCSLAGQGVALLRGLGYSRVREFAGGMEEWTERGGRIERAALADHAAAPPRPAGKLARLARFSPAAAFAWASDQPLRILFDIWLAIGTLFAIAYWSAAGLGGGGLAAGAVPVARDLAGLGTAFGFSFAMALSASYGEVAAMGWMRYAALVETALCLVLFSALISRVLGARQEALLSEVHRLAFENRIGRVRTNLHLVLAELGEISGDCENPAVPPRRLRTRMEGVAMIFAGEMQAVRDLVHGHPGEADDSTLEALFTCLAAGLQELADLLTCLPARQAAVRHPAAGPAAHRAARRRSLRRLLRPPAHPRAPQRHGPRPPPLPVALRRAAARGPRAPLRAGRLRRPGPPAAGSRGAEARGPRLVPQSLHRRLNGSAPVAP